MYDDKMDKIDGIDEMYKIKFELTLQRDEIDIKVNVQN